MSCCELSNEFYAFHFNFAEMSVIRFYFIFASFVRQNMGFVLRKRKNEMKVEIQRFTNEAIRYIPIEHINQQFFFLDCKTFFFFLFLIFILFGIPVSFIFFCISLFYLFLYDLKKAEIVTTAVVVTDFFSFFFCFVYEVCKVKRKIAKNLLSYIIILIVNGVFHRFLSVLAAVMSNCVCSF